MSTLESIKNALLEADITADSATFCTLSLKHFDELSLEEKLTSIFHHWKQNSLERVKELSLEYPLKDFFEVHKLRTDGKLIHSYKLLKKLSKERAELIIQYRYAAECIEYENLKDSESIISNILKKLPEHRKKILLFNQAVSLCNQSQFSKVIQTLGELSQARDDLSKFFFYWLSGMYQSQLGDHQKSYDYYLYATNLANIVPSRQTDVSLTAFGAIREAFWLGDADKTHYCLNIIKKEIKNKSSSIGENQFLIAKALHEFVTGDLNASLNQFDHIYNQEKWGNEHLQASYFYIWIIIALSKFNKATQIIEKLEQFRDQQGYSKNLYQFNYFKTYCFFMTNKISRENALTQFITEIQEKSFLEQTFHVEWAQGLYLLTFDDLFENAKCIRHFEKYPLIQRLLTVVLINKSDTKAHFVWNYISASLNDKLANILCNIRVAQLTTNLSKFVQNIKDLEKQKALHWIIHIDQSIPLFTYEYAKKILGSHFIIDKDNHRVISVKSGETLDQQPQLAELFIELSKTDSVSDKEKIAVALGYTNYNPLQVDPIIYNLLTRLRSWLKKENDNFNILNNSKGWLFDFADYILSFSLESSIEIKPNQAVAPVVGQNLQDLNPRQIWIYETLLKKKYLSRNDVIKNFNIKKSTVANDFNTLIDSGLIKRKGAGRGVFYTLAKTET